MGDFRVRRVCPARAHRLDPIRVLFGALVEMDFVRPDDAIQDFWVARDKRACGGAALRVGRRDAFAVRATKIQPLVPMNFTPFEKSPEMSMVTPLA